MTVAGERLDQLSDHRLAAWRARHIGFVFQLYNLMPMLTAERNVELPLLLTHLSKAERKKHVEAALAVVGLSHRAKHYPRTLSGGEQQRVGIARGIVTDPTLLLCDEPTGDLDRKAGNEILDLLQALNREHGKTIIMVTHDPHASARASRTVYLDKGQLSNEPVQMKSFIVGAEVTSRTIIKVSAADSSLGGHRFRRHEILPSHLVQSEAEETAHVADAAVDRRGVHPVRVSVGHQAGAGGRRELAGADRLVVRHKVSIIQFLPESYKARMDRIPGVDFATHQTWFGGIYQDPKNFFMQNPVVPEEFLEMHPEIILPPEQKKAWLPRGPARSSAAGRRSASTGKSATGFPFNPPSGRRRTETAPGNLTSWAFTTGRKGHRHDAAVFPL